VKLLQTNDVLGKVRQTIKCRTKLVKGNMCDIIRGTDNSMLHNALFLLILHVTTPYGDSFYSDKIPAATQSSLSIYSFKLVVFTLIPICIDVSSHHASPFPGNFTFSKSHVLNVFGWFALYPNSELNSYISPISRPGPPSSRSSTLHCL
jgi:hypothetical protein